MRGDVHDPFPAVNFASSRSRVSAEKISPSTLFGAMVFYGLGGFLLGNGYIHWAFTAVGAVMFVFGVTFMMARCALVRNQQ